MFLVRVLVIPQVPKGGLAFPLDQWSVSPQLPGLPGPDNEGLFSRHRLRG